jgi:hypothetical protein
VSPLRIEVKRANWKWHCGHFGPDHPAARAAFGRYVAAMGGTLTEASAGWHAWVANVRARYGRGLYNRRWRAYAGRGHNPRLVAAPAQP